jgi:uncharacterized protein (TIGR03000 family)
LYRPYYDHHHHHHDFFFGGFFGFYGFGFYDPWLYPYYYPYYTGAWYAPDFAYAPSVAELRPYLSDMAAPPALPNDDMVHMRLKVPAEDAEVWFENQKTEQTGTQRDFDSPSLTPGQTYTYEVRLRWMENGRPNVQTRKLAVRPGEWLLIDLTKPPPPERITMPRAKQ